MSLWRSTAFLVKGAREFTKGGYEKAAKDFDSSVMKRDLKGATCMVTGSNQGVGYQIAEDLARRGCILMMVCRSQQKGEDAVRKVVEATGNKDVHLRICDVSSLASVREFVREVEGSGQQLHVLVNNAGIMAKERSKSADGLELSFATNTVGAFALTRLLEPVLKRSAPSRVIFVTSGGMYTEKLELEDMQLEKMKKYDGQAAYAKDKRRMQVYAEEFARRWQGSEVGSYSMHPGWADSGGARDAMAGLYKTMEGRIRTLPQGAETAVWLALQDQSQLEAGGFYLDRKPQAKHVWGGGTQYTPQDAERLWTSLSQLAGIPA